MNFVLKLLLFLATLLPGASYAKEVVVRASVGNILGTIEDARRIASNGTNVTLIIPPGIYRESIVVKDWGEGAGTLTLQAERKGETIITGTDVWTEWVKDGDVYVHDWPYRWGLVTWPKGWRAKDNKPIIRRREMVFVDGVLMRQVIRRDRLRRGSFFVDETHRALLLKLPVGVDMGRAKIEVSVRSNLLTIADMKGVSVRGLIFRGASDSLARPGAVRIVGSNNITLEDNRFEFNNWAGLFVAVTNDLSTARNVMNHNGGVGWNGWKMKRLRSEDDETSFNNWRGAWGGFVGWAVAGTKHLRVHDAVYLRYTATNNQARGFWLDFDIQGVTITDPRWTDNLTDGVFFEGLRENVALIGGVVARNGRSGISASGARGLTIKGTKVMGNLRYQIRVSGDKDRPYDNWETGDVTVLNNENWKIENAHIRASGDQRIVSVLGHQLAGWSKTLRVRNNVCSTERSTPQDSLICGR